VGSQPRVRPIPRRAAAEARPAGNGSVESARSAGLRWVSDAAPGIRRVRAGRGFTYLQPSGRPLRDARALARIRSLAIPPAWTDVWICTDTRGHLQATGRDARGRKQYRYHARWREVRDGTKYGRLLEFGCCLPRIRERVDHDLARRGMPREKVLATVVRLLEKTLIRVGNEEYARANRSFGLTTLTGGHVKVRGPRIHFRFRGKSGKVHEFGIEDRELSRIVKRCQDLPGQELFQYEDGRGRRRVIGSGDVNAYLREVSGRDFTAKDFRTWAGTVRASWALESQSPPASRRQAARAVKEAITDVARRLGNTPAICRKSYVHPAVVESYVEGRLQPRLHASVRSARVEPALRILRPSEAALLRLLSAWKRPNHHARRPGGPVVVVPFPAP
jgi:DNA topoisomerase I